MPWLSGGPRMACCSPLSEPKLATLREALKDNNPDNTVIGLVRNKSETEKEMTEEIPGRDNVHIIQGHLTDYASLQAAGNETAKIIGVVSYFGAYDPIGVLSYPPVKVNVIGNIHLFNVFIPLLQRGTVKVIAISTDQEALDIIPKLKIEVASVYAVSKSGLNTAVAKLAAQYGKEGILFMSVCPGMVDSGHFADEDAVRDVLRAKRVGNGDGGSFVSHYGISSGSESILMHV
ncbi:hypothetical protein BDW68DRAFT_186067 [Aspergillus falconensis]